MQVPLLRAFWIEPFFKHPLVRDARSLQGLAPHFDPATLGQDVACPARHAHRVVEGRVRASGARCGCELGFSVGHRTGVLELGFFGRQIAAAPTLREAIRTAGRLMPSVHSARTIELRSDRRCARLSSRVLGSSLGVAPWEDGFVASLLIQIVRLAAGSDWHPNAVEVQSPGSFHRHCRGELQGVPVRYAGPATAIEFPAALLDRPLPSARQPRRAVNDPRPFPPDVLGRVRLALEYLLSQVEDELSANIVTLAALLGTSRRSLQRRLGEPGQTFSRILEEVRKEKAVRLLGEPSTSVIDVAFELGYSDPSHFTRAFRRWTGVAPSTYRLSA